MKERDDIYYANDKELFDAIVSTKKLYSSQFLRNICRQRNTFISEKDEREKVVEYFSELPHSSKDLKQIVETIKINTNKTEKNTSINLKSNEIDITALKENIIEVADKRQEKFNEAFNLIAECDNPNHLILDMEYEAIDFGSTRLKQKKKCYARIEVELHDNGETTIRCPANEKAKEVVSNFVKVLEEKKEQPIERNEVSLEFVTNGKLRTQFFISLIKSIPNLNTCELNYIHSSIKETLETYEEDEGNATNEAMSKLQSIIVSGTSLENFLTEPEYLEFEKKGFYITGIKWKAITIDGLKCIIEAEFKDTENCRDFVYEVKGYYPKNSDGSYQKSIKPLEGKIKQEILRNLESTSLDVCSQIKTLFNSNKKGAN